MSRAEFVGITALVLAIGALFWWGVSSAVENGRINILCEQHGYASGVEVSRIGAVCYPAPVLLEDVLVE